MSRPCLLVLSWHVRYGNVTALFVYYAAYYEIYVMYLCDAYIFFGLNDHKFLFY